MLSNLVYDGTQAQNVTELEHRVKQAVKGPRRRQKFLSGSKLAKGLQSVKVFFSKVPEPKSWTNLTRKGNF